MKASYATDNMTTQDLKASQDSSGVETFMTLYHNPPHRLLKTAWFRRPYLMACSAASL